MIKKKWALTTDSAAARIAFLEAIASVPAKPKKMSRKQRTVASASSGKEKKGKLSTSLRKYQIIGKCVTSSKLRELIAQMNKIDKDTIGGDLEFKVGSLVSAFYCADVCWFGGRIKAIEDKQHTVEFFDGEIKVYEDASEIDNGFDVGDTVLGKWSMNNKWYKGMILSVEGSSFDDMKYIVLFDKHDGVKQQEVKALTGDCLQIPHIGKDGVIDDE